MNFYVALGDWSAFQIAAQAIRFDVFVHEQYVPIELELDEMDPLSLHALAYGDDGLAIGTGRLLPDGHIGRMAVSKRARGIGVGSAILKALLAAARQRGDTQVMLNAQTQAEAFYGRYGFMRSGAIFDDAGLPHIAMRLAL